MASSGQSGVCSQSKYMRFGGCIYTIMISLIALLACVNVPPFTQAYAIEGESTQSLAVTQMNMKESSKSDFYAVLYKDVTLVFQKAALLDDAIDDENDRCDAQNQANDCAEIVIHSRLLLYTVFLSAAGADFTLLFHCFILRNIAYFVNVLHSHPA